jgi:Na+:H+ antiporter, NhaA family
VRSLWSSELSIRLADHELTEDLRHRVNDGLMSSSSWSWAGDPARAGDGRAGRPAPAAVADDRRHRRDHRAGRDLPGHQPQRRGRARLGVAMSTDTAFMLGVLALLGPACPTQLRAFLLTLAIADDVGALAIIALSYSDEVSIAPLAVAPACVLVILALGRLRVWRGPAYFLAGAVLWVAMLESGVHPAIAGVLIAVGISVYPPRPDEVERAAVLTRAFRQSPLPSLARSANLTIERAISPNERLQQLSHPWTSFVVVPASPWPTPACRSATTPCATSTPRATPSPRPSPSAPGWGAAARRGAGGPARRRGPSRASASRSRSSWSTSFTSQEPADQAKIGVPAASTIAALLGWGAFRVSAARQRARGVVPGAAQLDPPVDPGRDHIRGPLTLR